MNALEECINITTYKKVIWKSSMYVVDSNMRFKHEIHSHKSQSKKDLWKNT